MKVKTIVSGPFETNSYIVYDEITKDAVLIDAPPDSFKEVNDFLISNNIKPEMLILTHGHIDHIADTEFYKNNLNIKILMHEKDLFWINPPSFMLNLIGGSYNPFKVDKMLLGGEQIEVGTLSFSIIHTPGHTPGGICVYFEKNKILFSGDTIFQESVGRVDLEGGSMELLLKSLKEKILILPDDTIIYPGHGDYTNIKNEKKFNPYLKNNGDSL